MSALGHKRTLARVRIMSALPPKADITPATPPCTIDLRSLFVLLIIMRTRGDMLRFAIAFALTRARKLVRGLRQGLSEDERYLVADDVVRRLQERGDPWRLSEEMPERTRKGYSTPPMNER